MIHNTQIKSLFTMPKNIFRGVLSIKFIEFSPIH